tara:strand:- start:7 stop:423 length:417 start_codon:yes stop_codon:yes gene_type:complete
MIKVLVNGAFDILHSGHINLLKYAKDIGNYTSPISSSYLVVALDTDERIRLTKGPDRPINSQRIRKLIMENLKPVDEVVLFGTDKELINIIKEVDIRVIGSDWKHKHIVGEEHCKLLFYDRTNNESTTNTIKNYLSRR